MSAPIKSDEKFLCETLHHEVHFTLTDEHVAPVWAFPLTAPIPHCNGWPYCGAFPDGFPLQLNSVTNTTPTGCPWFDKVRECF